LHELHRAIEALITRPIIYQARDKCGKQLTEGGEIRVTVGLLTKLIALCAVLTGQSVLAASDDFNRANSDSLGANWTEAAGDQDILTNELDMVSMDFVEQIVIYGASSGTNQYVKATWSGTQSSSIFPRFVLRYTNGSTEFYSIEIDAADGAEWSHNTQLAGTGTVIATAAIAVAEGDVFAATITGTVNSTEVRIWKNPTGDMPDSATSWGGDSTPDITWLEDPGNPVDSGNFTGLGVFHNEGGGGVTFDNWSTGDLDALGGGVIVNPITGRGGAAAQPIH